MGNEGPAPRIYVGKANGVKMNQQQQPEVQATERWVGSNNNTETYATNNAHRNDKYENK